MKIINGIKFGGLQQKILNLMLVFIIILVGAFVAVSIYQQNNLTKIVQQTSVEQQASIEAVSEETMKTVLETSMVRSTALQAYIADDLFGDVRSDVLTLQTFATELFEHADNFSGHAVDPPSAANDGVPAAQLIHEEGVDPEDSQLLGLVGNMSEVMLSMFETSDKLSSVFIGTADGNMVLVNDRSGVFVSADGTPLPLDIRNRPWYTQAAAAGEVIFTGVVMDAYTESPMLECAAPVYQNGRLVAVVAADVYLTAISDYVESAAASGGFLCVVNADGPVLFSPQKSGVFKPELSGNAADLREDGSLGRFVIRALRENTGLEEVSVDGKDYYMTGAPMATVGWAVISVVEKEITHQPTAAMLARYDEINEGALSAYTAGASNSAKSFVILTIVIFLLAIIGALVVAGRIVKPIELMMRRIDSLSGSDNVFEMEDAYRTGDEIEILAQSFASLSQKTRNYITQITQITAEKERIGAELTLAAGIQTHMLPNIFPAFPEREEFDIYATMDPAKEVGGDFYDFFMIGEDHLGMVVADVSGKGVPAALFSMIAKTMLKTQAQTRLSPERVLLEVNATLTENNEEDMFVTVWLGVLEISTGELTYADAGHEKLLLYQSGEWRFLPKSGGVALAMWEPEDLELMDEKYRFHNETIHLAPGDAIFQYTDGVTEATDAQEELFGDDRLLDAMNSAPTAKPEELLPHVRAKIDEFVKEAPQFDDITMLGLQYKGSGQN